MLEVHHLLAPLVALVAWTIIMMFVAVYKIQRGIKGADLSGLRKAARARDLDGHVDGRILYARENYEHLVEQPTLFYAIVLALALMGATHPFNVGLAWAYVLLRIGHSVVQTMGRRRGFFFVTSTLALLLLVIHAGMELAHHL
ncbi:MAPEG family protein [Sphingomicrobium aestuariivivum]|uniref:MAPEG family protein n=1 Tax=Sphingomicrobium aestuariivivum TaxID=1582356 RepID=UPI001FD649AA|nr:MAPEG family protein [Sphingomicrobium aestuariivivum]MCJ8189884.1 MAPEG family protein [Sphingomicrobium aestuariivivum]